MSTGWVELLVGVTGIAAGVAAGRWILGLFFVLVAEFTTLRH